MPSFAEDVTFLLEGASVCCMDKFKNRLRCKIFVFFDLVLAVASLIILLGLDGLYIIKSYFHVTIKWGCYYMGAVILGYTLLKYNKLEDYPEINVEITALSAMNYIPVALSHVCRILLLILGPMVIRACTLSPLDLDTLPFEKGIKSCDYWSTLAFLRVMLHLLGLSFRLLVFSLINFDELTDYEIIRQSTVFIPLTSIFLAWVFTNKYRTEIHTHLHKELVPNLRRFYCASAQ